MNTRTVLAIGASLGVMLSTAACGGSSNSSSTSKPPAGSSGSPASQNYQLLNPGTLSVGTNSANKPMESISNNKWVGYDIDFMNKIAAGLGLKVQYTGSQFAPLLSGVATHRYDLGIASASITCARAKNLAFALPNFVGKIDVVSPAKTGITSLKGLAGKRLGVETASIEDDYAKKTFKDAQIVEFPTFDAILTAMKGGQIDAAFIDNGRASTYKSQVGGTVKTVASIPVPQEPAAIFLPKSSDTLRLAVNKQIRKLVSDGTYKSIYLKYYGPPAPKLPLDFKLQCG